jgi:hypothetical protein
MTGKERHGWEESAGVTGNGDHIWFMRTIIMNLCVTEWLDKEGRWHFLGQSFSRSAFPTQAKRHLQHGIRETHTKQSWCLAQYRQTYGGTNLINPNKSPTSTVKFETARPDCLKWYLPRTKVGHDSILAVNPFRKIWWRNMIVSEFKKIELTSSCVQGGFWLEAAILKGLRKQEMRSCSCSMYSSSASTIRNTRLPYEGHIQNDRVSRITEKNSAHSLTH